MEPELTENTQGGSRQSSVDSWLDEWEQKSPTEQPTSGHSEGARAPAAEPVPPESASTKASVDRQDAATNRRTDRAAPSDAGSPPVAPGPSLAKSAARMPTPVRSGHATPQHSKRQASQRRARVIQKKSDSGLASITGELSTTTERQRTGRRRAMAVGFVLLVAAVGLVGYLFTGFQENAPSALGIDAAQPAGNESVASPEAELDLSTSGGPPPQSVEELARSTVQLIGLTSAGDPACAGSGVLIGADGTILTNAHVVTSGPGCEFSSVGVAVIENSGEPAKLQYRAELLAVDRKLDLAVLRIVAYLTETIEPLPEFSVAALGDSDTVDLGDDIRILGYPVIGGETITFTNGSVSGFTKQAGIGNRALIKTDATIAAGNSGGIAVDADGRVVGIPTKARASETGPAVDCRPLSDTNEDGRVDDEDICVPVGGFLNGVRPINLAKILLQQAQGADPIGTVLRPRGDVDLSNVTFSNPRFSLGKNDETNQPIDIVTTASAGIPEICFFADWQGVPDGTVWDGVWYVDGELAPRLGFTDITWANGESGENFWLCAPGLEGDGLPAGIYEIGFFLEGEVVFAEGFEIVEDEVDVHTIDWSNNTDVEVCGLAINPLAESGQTGLNELEPGDSIPPGESRPLELATGRVVVEAYDCLGRLVADAYDGLDIEQSTTLLIGLEPEG